MINYSVFITSDGFSRITCRIFQPVTTASSTAISPKSCVGHCQLRTMSAREFHSKDWMPTTISRAVAKT